VSIYDVEEMISTIDYFLDLYEKRPLKDNRGGMGFNQSWATWYLVNKIGPALILESGVHRGHSTWLLEQAAPSAQILSFDVNLKNRIYISKSVTYTESDFFSFDWSKYDLSNCLAFFDDHQNQYERIIRSYWLGIRKIILEDVWPVGEGDCYSMKHILNGSGFAHIQMSVEHKGNLFKRILSRYYENVLDSFRESQFRIVSPNTFDRDNLKARAKVILEMPPVYLEERNSWGKPYSGVYSTRPPLLGHKPLKDADYSFYYLTYLELQ